MRRALTALGRGITRPLDVLADRRLAAERAAVATRPRVLPLALRFLGGLGALQVVLLTEPGPLQLVATMAVALIVGGWAGHAGQRARAYSRGWYGGRSAMVSALGEAQIRGMSVHDWLARELRRDLTNLGEDALPATCPRCGTELRRRRPGWCRHCAEVTLRPSAGHLVRADGDTEDVRFIETGEAGRYRAVTVDGEPVRVDLSAGDALGVDVLAPGQSVDIGIDRGSGGTA